MSDSARHNMYFAQESSYGTLLVDPSFNFLRHTGTTLNTSKSSAVSEELQSNRQIPNFRHGTNTVGGDINFESSYGSHDALLEAALQGTWTSDVLKAGTTRRSFHVIRHFSDLAAAAKPYHIYTGVEMNTLNLTVPADGGIVTGSFGAIGQDQQLSQDAVTELGAGTLFGSAGTNVPFASFTGSVEENALSLAIATEISLSLTNNLEARFAIGSDQTLEPSVGRSNVTGSIGAYFENATLLEKFLNETESSLKFTLTDPAGNDLEFFLPKIKYTGGQPDVSGQGAITLNLPFQALYDTTEATNLRITRTSA